jgi:CHAD domain-containing protein
MRQRASRKTVVEEENKQTVEAAPDDMPAASASAEKRASIASRRALTRLLRKRVKKFLALVPEILTSGSPKTVHDIRVCSRRLQQTVSAFFPKPRSGKVRRLRRTPRRVRRALGEWRNCDVLLEIVARQERHTRSEAKRQAWALLREHLSRKRSKQVARAGKRLLRQDLANYAALAHGLLAQPADEDPESLLQRLRGSVQQTSDKWQSALARAQETRATADLHALRIATKALRYRIELLYDLGYKDLRTRLKWLEDLQEALGAWHDRQVLDQAIAQTIARPEILLNELQAARILLAELEKERSRENAAVDKIFRLATEHPARQEMENWSEAHSLLTPHSSREGETVKGEGQTDMR